MRAVVVCVLALAFAAFAVSSVAARGRADVEMVESELVDADHPALMEVVRARRSAARRGGARRGDDKTKAVGAKGKSKSKANAKSKSKFNGAKGGQKADGWTGAPAGEKGKQKVVKGDSPKPGSTTKTIGGHGTGAFGGQKADGWNANAGQSAINKGASKGGPIGGAWKSLFGNKAKKPQAGNTGIVPPLTGLPHKYPPRSPPQFGNTGIAGGVPGSSPVPQSGNTGVVPPLTGLPHKYPPRSPQQPSGNTGVVPPLPHVYPPRGPTQPSGNTGIVPPLPHVYPPRGPQQPGNTGIVPPLTGLPHKYPPRSPPQFGNGGIAGGVPGASSVPQSGNTGIVPPGVGGH